MKKRAAVICPGRGTYNKSELGYLARFHQNKESFLKIVDGERAKKGQPPVTELDGKESFSFKEHIPGHNSAALIYACSYCDFLDIDQDQFEIVAITGNSMGWYLAQACAGVYTEENAIKVVNTMGSMTQTGLIGAQIIYPIINNDWQPDHKIKQKILDLIAKTDDCYISIYFGGYLVIGGSDQALDSIMDQMEKIDQYPFKIPGNSAFHTPLLNNISLQACQELAPELLQPPQIPLIDGEGHIWMSHSFDQLAMWNYTFKTQVTESYNFSKAIEITVKEFAPDVLIITGPGTTMGGAVGQSLIEHGLYNLHSKADFIRSKQNPVVIGMGDQQRTLVTKRNLYV